MSQKNHVLAQQLLGQPTLEACDLQEVEKLANRFPYFAPAQFLLLQKLKSTNDPRYGVQLQKAVLYYHNPLAFEYFIDAERFYTDDILVEATSVAAIPEAVATVATPGVEREETETEMVTTDQVISGNEAVPAGVIPDAAPMEVLSENEALPVEEQEPATTKPVETTSALPVPNVPEPAASDLAFEPFHTVDYFASQGIKLSQEDIPKDKFGKQLKSFTEWLKTMKRLPAQTAAMDASTERNLEHLAEDSVHNPEVVTEAMAEVWLKQGNREKAIETYNKLSLLNPSKKAFFAALIENLKRS